MVNNPCLFTPLICDLIGDARLSVSVHCPLDHKRALRSGCKLVHPLCGIIQKDKGPLAGDGGTQSFCLCLFYWVFWCCLDPCDFRAASLKTCGQRALRSWAYAAGVPGDEVITAGLQFNMTSRGKFGSLPSARKKGEKPVLGRSSYRQAQTVASTGDFVICTNKADLSKSCLVAQLYRLTGHGMVKYVFCQSQANCKDGQRGLTQTGALDL